jgi:hypothetical protein
MLLNKLFTPAPWTLPKCEDFRAFPPCQQRSESVANVGAKSIGLEVSMTFRYFCLSPLHSHIGRSSIEQPSFEIIDSYEYPFKEARGMKCPTVSSIHNSPSRAMVYLR